MKAVEEVLTTRRAYMFASFVKTVLWAMAATLVLIYVLPATERSGVGLAVSAVSMTGGFVCGLGMAVNGGCAFSTLSRLSSGDAAMLVTLASFVVGAAAIGPAMEVWGAASAAQVSLPFAEPERWTAALLVLLALWAAWELIRWFRARTPGLTVIELALSDTYRMSTSAIVMGLTAGLIFSLSGTWTYTSTLVRAADSAAGYGSAPDVKLWALFAALLLGMWLSAWQGGRFRLVLRPSLSWLRKLVGGLLMGAGAAMVPGGNDTVLLHGLPNLSLHAATVYLAMVLGIGAVMTIVGLTGSGLPEVNCRGDICKVR